MFKGVDDLGPKKLNIINRRMFIISAAKIVVFSGIISKLFSLQINQNKKYLTLSDKNRLREWRLPPVRGEFLDYFDNTIAGNLKVYQLHVIPEQVENFRYLLVRLRDILQLSKKEFYRIIKKKNSQKSWETLIISENLSWDQFSKVNFYLHELVGAKPVLSVSRNYPFKENYTHVLGYVSQASESDLLENEIIKKSHVPGLRVGKIGLEKTFENELIGTNGIQRYEVNAYGKRINQLEFKEGKKGKNIRLTLDTEIQKLCNELLKDKAGSISVMDIYSGEIVAMHSSPSFDPNLFIYGISKNDWQAIRENPLKPLTNKTISGLYSPGSTIKPLVALSALENDVVSIKQKVHCKGKMEMYGQKYHCWKEKGHGFVNMREGIKQSCDIYFYEVARRLGVDRLSITAKDFGLGQAVLDNFNEEKVGIVPNTKWKLKNIGKNWLLGETLISGIGQGYYLSTPIQLCLMTSQLANGGYKIKPRIIDDKYALEPIIDSWRKKFTSKDQNLDQPGLKKLYKNPENIKFVLDAMYGATNEPMGTSYRSRSLKKEYIYAGKTGTSQVRSVTKKQRELKLKNKDLPYNQRDHALFIAFAPYKNPRYAISIVIEHGGAGSTGAAPIAKKLIKKVLDRHKLRKRYQLDLFQEV